MNFTHKSCILFDLDGTLADSLGQSRNAYHQVLASYDKKGTEEEFLEMCGLSLLESCLALKHRHRLSPPVDALYRQYLSLHSENYSQRVSPVPGAHQLLAWLREQNKRLALVTSATSSFAGAFLEAQNWSRFFEVIRCCDHVPIAKPHPALYLSAIQALAVSTRDAIAVEDSPSGVTSAHKAGIFTVAIGPSHFHKSLQGAGADKIFSSLLEFSEHLQGSITQP